MMISAKYVTLCVVAATMVMFMVTGGCSDSGFRVDVDRGGDRPPMSTYAWLSDAPTVPDDSRVDVAELDRVIRDEVDRQLQAKGYVRKDRPPASFQVTYLAAIRQKVSSTSLVEQYDRVRVESFIGASSEPRPSPRTYEQGTLVLDFSGGADIRCQWRGSAKASLHLDQSQVKRHERVKQAIQVIMSRFPAREPNGQ